VLLPDRSAITESFSASVGIDGLLSFVVEDAIPGKAYQIEVSDQNGSLLYADSQYTSFDRFGAGHIIFPAELMRPGKYRLRIINKNRDRPNEIIDFKFLVKSNSAN
jgi:hypothetical protein